MTFHFKKNNIANTCLAEKESDERGKKLN